MEAVLLSVAVSLPQHKSHVVCLMCDNAVVVSYIIKEGGTKSFRLTCLMIRLLKFCNQKDIKLMPVHLPGSRNIQANALSHVGQTLLTEWVVFHPVFSSWGTPVIDLFATLRTGSCLSSHHHSWTWGPNTSMPCQCCGMGMVYTLPPFKMLPAVLKIRGPDDLSVFLVALHLMAASWMPELLNQSRCLPLPMEGHPLLKQEVWMPRGHVKTRH